MHLAKKVLDHKAHLAFLSLGLLALITGCGGGGAPGGGNGGGSGMYLAPVDLGTTSNGVVAALPSGQMVGSDSSGRGLYWSSPTASPQNVAGGTPLGLAIVSGQVKIVGYDNSNPNQAAVWNSPTSSPTVLPAPGGTASFANGIDSKGNIVGEIETSPSINPVHNAVIWPNTSTFTYLLGIGGAAKFAGSAADIFEDGSIVSTDGSVWASKTASPTLILPTFLSSSFLISSKAPTGFGQSFFYLPSDISDSSIWVAFESSGTFSAVRLPNPSGDIYARMTGTSPNGWVFGTGETTTGPEVGKDHGFVWKDSTSAPTLMESLIPTLNGWHINYVDFGFNNGSLLAEGTNPGVDGGASHYLLLNPKP